MAMDYNLKQMLKQTVTIATYASRNSYNEFTHGTGTSVACRIVKDFKAIRTADGRDVISSTQIYVDGDTDLGESKDVSVNCKITLPDGSTPEVLHIESFPDETGVTYYKAIYT